MKKTLYKEEQKKCIQFPVRVTMTQGSHDLGSRSHIEADSVGAGASLPIRVQILTLPISGYVTFDK